MQYFKKVCDMHCIYDDIEKKTLYYILVCDWTLQTAASVSANQTKHILHLSFPDLWSGNPDEVRLYLQQQHYINSINQM